MRYAFICTAVAVLAAGCGGPQRQAFEPSERATAISPQGFTAADYDLDTRAGDLGEAKVWSRGAYQARVRGERRTVVHVGFEIENHSGEPLAVDTSALRLDSATIDEHTLRDLRPVEVRGALSVQPGEVTQVTALFALPPGVSPGEVRAFRVRWSLRDTRREYTQHTPFLRRPELYVAAPSFYYSPFYDPFFYSPFVFPRRVIVHPHAYRHHHRY